MALGRESEAVTASPELKRRIDRRMGSGSTFRVRALAVSVALALVAVGVAVWLIAGRGPVRSSLIDEPSRDTYFAGYWPVATRAEAEAMQERVDAGEETWRRDSRAVAKAYGESLGWMVAPNPELYGDTGHGGGTVITIRPMIGEGATKQPGTRHLVELETLGDGNKKPVWFVTGITSENIVLSAPSPNETIGSPVRVAGTGIAFEGNILVSVHDDDGRELGSQPVQAGGTERMPFDGEIGFSAPSAPAGTVRFEGGNGIGGPSTDVTIRRVRFGDSTATPVEPSPGQQGSVVPADYMAADDAFRCFFNARRYRDLEMAKACMTERYAESITDPVEFIGPSSPNVERATIISSARDGDRVVYDTFVYWGSSSGLQFVSEDTVTVLVEGDEAFVDAWTQGSQVPMGETRTVGLKFLAPGDTPKCEGGAMTEDSFVTIDRVVPDEAVVDDLVLSVVREMATGHWAHEGDAADLFGPGTRVERVSVADGKATIELNRLPDRMPCDFVGEALGQTLVGLERGITDFELRHAPPQEIPSEPDV